MGMTSAGWSGSNSASSQRSQLAISCASGTRSPPAFVYPENTGRPPPCKPRRDIRSRSFRMRARSSRRASFQPSTRRAVRGPAPSRRAPGRWRAPWKKPRRPKPAGDASSGTRGRRAAGRRARRAARARALRFDFFRHHPPSRVPIGTAWPRKNSPALMRRLPSSCTSRSSIAPPFAPTSRPRESARSTSPAGPRVRRCGDPHQKRP